MKKLTRGQARTERIPSWQAAAGFGCVKCALPLRAQAAVEVLAYSAFFMLVFVATVAIFFQQQSQGLTRAENAYAQEIAYGFADHIHTAFVAGPGFSQTVTIPNRLLGKPYIIALSFDPSPATTETGFVYVEWQGSSGNASFSAPTITTAYKPTTTGGVNNDNGFITIRANTSLIIIDSAYGQALCMKNKMESGANKITIEPAASCP